MSKKKNVLIVILVVLLLVGGVLGYMRYRDRSGTIVTTFRDKDEILLNKVTKKKGDFTWEEPACAVTILNKNGEIVELLISEDEYYECEVGEYYNGWTKSKWD